MNNYREPVKVLADIIGREMNIDPARVVIYNEKYNIPADDGIWIMLALVAPESIGVSNTIDADGNELQIANIAQMIQIDIMSANADARIRHFEVLLALSSIYAQKQSEIYNLKIARLPTSMTDASSEENSKILNRYTFTVVVNHSVVKVKPIQDSFNALQGAAITVDVFPGKTI